jgi:hypothetical protein
MIANRQRCQIGKSYRVPARQILLRFALDLITTGSASGQSPRRTEY